MKAYKYFKSSLTKKILEEGSFRIGTLYDYRKTEGHGEEIGDPKEGKVGAHSQILSWSSSDPRLIDEHANSFVKGNTVIFREGSSISFKPGGSIRFGVNDVSFQNISLRSELQIQDLYIFSFSLKADSKLMKKMGYDACYEILDIDSFLQRLGAPPLCRYLGWKKVSYEPKEVHYTIAKTKNPAVIKEPCFEYQQECRALWIPQNQPISPCITTAPGAVQLCSLVEFPN